MRILFVTGLTGFGIGGARTEEVRLVRGIAERGHVVGMCSDVLSEELKGTTHYRLDYPPGDNAPRQLQTALAEFRPDLVHVVGGGVRFLAVCDQQIKDVPWVFTAHNVPPAERIFPRLYGNAALHYAVRNMLAWPSVWSWKKYLKGAGFRLAICHSQTVMGRLKQVGCPAGKIREIPFGSELPASALTPDPSVASGFSADAWPKIVTVAGLAYHKGQVDAIHMAHRLAAEFPKLDYRLVGMTRDKKYRAFLENTIERLGLKERVSIVHAAPEPVKFALLREADLYIQPSHEEGFCIAYLEAAMLTPRLIGADTGAIAAMASEDRFARVVKAGDVAGLASAARDLLRQRAVAGVVEQRRQLLAGRYSWEAYLQAHDKAYAEAAGAGAPV